MNAPLTTSARLLKPTLLARRVWLPWREGPAARHDGPVVVSLTDFTATHVRDLPGIYLAGLRLREGWYALPGAVGVWLWGRPLEGRGGSLTVWTSEEDLRRFVSLPAHLAIMRRYRERGTIKAYVWETERFAVAPIMEWANGHLP